ncbi:MAG: hypothetical protein RLZZ490_585 [Cyanobacteriota bacterium]
MDVYSQLAQTELTQVSGGEQVPLLQDCDVSKPLLVLVWPQLGDFDSLEYAWWLKRSNTFLRENHIQVRAVGIGDRRSGEKFCDYTGFAPENLWIDPSAQLHRQLGLYEGLSRTWPGLTSQQSVWLNLLLMCAGIGSPGTLKEVFRGYTGDRQAPQLIGDQESVKLSPFPTVTGSVFALAGGKGFQRPFELATLRLRNMIEVLGNWSTYVPDARYITQRGGTFLFDADQHLIFEHRDPGILGFSPTMANPITAIANGIACTKTKA